MNLLKSVVTLGSVISLFVSLSAGATLVCGSCSYLEEPTYLGLHNPVTFDESIFSHGDIEDHEGPLADFVDFWVFDLASDSTVLATGSYSNLSPIENFAVNLWTDLGGTACDAGPLPTACVIDPGEIRYSQMDAGASRGWSLPMNLTAGRYIFQILGTTNAVQTPSMYSVNLQVGSRQQVHEPAALVLFAMGMIGLIVFKRQSALMHSARPL